MSPLSSHSSHASETAQMDTSLLLALVVAVTNQRTERDPKPGDLVVETTMGRRADPDAIGWLEWHGDAPYGADDPLDGSVPMREVWDIIPLNPEATLRAIDGVWVQRWENAEFQALPKWIADELGLKPPPGIVP